MITCGSQEQRGRQRRALAAQAGDRRKTDALTMEPASADSWQDAQSMSWVKVTATLGVEGDFADTSFNIPTLARPVTFTTSWSSTYGAVL